jgi:hypothetical protein
MHVMSARIALVVAALLAGDLLIASANADCICRAQGREYELGKTACLATPKGPRLATCGMVLNNTSWQFSDTPCVVSSSVEPAADREQALVSRFRSSPAFAAHSERTSKSKGH